ncbi:unnamed protein product [Boreogadus saida]
MWIEPPPSVQHRGVASFPPFPPPRPIPQAATLQRLHSPPPHRRQRDKDSAFVQRQEASDSVDGAATTPPPSAPGTVVRRVGQQLPNDPTRSSSGSFARTKEGLKGKVSGLGQGAEMNKVRKHGGEEEGLVKDRLVEGTEEPVCLPSLPTLLLQQGAKDAGNP